MRWQATATVLRRPGSGIGLHRLTADTARRIASTLAAGSACATASPTRPVTSILQCSRRGFASFRRVGMRPAAQPSKRNQPRRNPWTTASVRDQTRSLWTTRVRWACTVRTLTPAPQRSPCSPSPSRPNRAPHAHGRSAARRPPSAPNPWLATSRVNTLCVIAGANTDSPACTASTACTSWRPSTSSSR